MRDYTSNNNSHLTSLKNADNPSPKTHLFFLHFFFLSLVRDLSLTCILIHNNQQKSILYNMPIQTYF